MKFLLAAVEFHTKRHVFFLFYCFVLARNGTCTPRVGVNYVGSISGAASSIGASRRFD